ncbi:MAG: AAA family ATPase [Candidatus Omnitrophica bacterium]|nr:AAA family ATPase [Candidatus Omnitrophota bacterium]
MKHLLIIGRPGVGKTTLIKQLAQDLRGHPIDGFFTEELREGGERLGFWLSSLDGRQALLAHRQLESPYRVGPYHVNVSVLDELAVSIIRRACAKSLILFIDEIGKMELCSTVFSRAVEETLVQGPPIVATGGIQSLPLLETLKHRKDVELVPLTASNWKSILEELRLRLQTVCDEDERIRTLQRQAEEISDLIVAGEVPEIDIEIQKAKLREMIARVLPDRVALYHLIYESRFRRLWQQFRSH